MVRECRQSVMNDLPLLHKTDVSYEGNLFSPQFYHLAGSIFPIFRLINLYLIQSQVALQNLKRQTHKLNFIGQFIAMANSH